MTVEEVNALSAIDPWFLRAIESLVREEQALGRPPISALTAGYERAMSAIIDANLTTLIAGILMFGFGSGPIKGFATTLSLGLLTSMFSSTIFTRMVLGLWLRWRRPRELVI